MKLFRVTTLLALLLVPIIEVGAQSNSAQVKIDTGILRGSNDGGVTAFKGIPFAAPPVGQNRWRAPQPAARWKGVRDATQYGSDCMQLPFPSDAAPLGTPPREDCLYLNVWTPSPKASANLPVMVWIYGGGFVNGGSSPAIYSGQHFAKGGVVFVSFNYRVGRFGFFSFPALSKEEAGQPLNNYAYMDQIAALKWVQTNIHAFGGNPDDVTIFGESAGGGSVLALLTSPMTKGLFERAIVESGGGRDALLGVRYLNKTSPEGLPSAESIGANFAKAMGIDGTGPAALAKLRALPAEKVVDDLNMASMGKQRDIYGGPILDGKLVTSTPEQALENGHYWKVPLIIGGNSADIGFPLWHTLPEIWSAFGPQAKQAQAAFDPTGKATAMMVGFRIAGEMMMLEPARFVAGTLAGDGVPSYEYRFSYVAKSLQGKWPGAFHASEIPYVFDSVAVKYGDALAPSDAAIAKQANEYWLNFAKTGNPNGPGLPHWPAYHSASDELMNFTEHGPVGEADPWKKQLDLVVGLEQRIAATQREHTPKKASGD
ncbi:MAG TPA: carboxylesterase family protein [Terracidiphilus sp.]|nr:carboxylesterase family protein [Terracidiphilus sp.]